MLGSISCVSESHAAIAISRGGAKKTYAHRDPNEDACGFAYSEWGTLLVVADGHAGCDASQIAIEHVVAKLAARLLGRQDPGLEAGWQELAVELALDVHAQILQAARIVSEYPPRTTLAIALARPRDDRLGWISVGDSLIFQANEKSATALGGEPEIIRYLGSPRDERERLARGIYAGVAPLAGTRAIALATDGLSEEGIGVPAPAAAVLQVLRDADAATAPDLRPLEAARALAETANHAHREQSAGDNIATAVAWLEPR